MSSDAAAKLWEDQINKSLIQLAHGSTSNEKLGAIVAIGTCAHIVQRYVAYFNTISQSIFLILEKKTRSRPNGAIVSIIM